MNNFFSKTNLVILVLVLTSYQPVSKQKIQIEVLNCMSSIAYQFDGDSVVIKDKNSSHASFSATLVDKNDCNRFLSISKKLIENPDNEVLNNLCINDGFHLKVFLTINGRKKKIFVGNFYDKRVDSLITIFDNFIDRSNQILEYNAFRYSKSKEDIERMIKEQEECNEQLSNKMKEHLLNSFCE